MKPSHTIKNIAREAAVVRGRVIAACFGILLLAFVEPVPLAIGWGHDGGWLAALLREGLWAPMAVSFLLGVPLCWIILTRGLWTKATLINAPLINYEVSQSGYGMYVKYLMAGFLLVYALSMMVQFCSSFLGNAAVLLDETEPVGAGDAEDSMEPGAVMPGAAGP